MRIKIPLPLVFVAARTSSTLRCVALVWGLVVGYIGESWANPMLTDTLIPIVPIPQQVQYLPGSLLLDNTQSVSLQFHRGDRSQQQDNPLAYRELYRLLSARFAEVDTSLVVGKATNDSENICFYLGLSKDPTIKRLMRQNTWSTDRIGDEGYYLQIRADTVLLLANTEVGLLYGVQSFKQLLRAYWLTEKIPAIQITDYPFYGNRAVMDDISRGPISNKDFIKTQILRLSELKINIFSFYIEHVIKTKQYPGFAPEEGLSLEELQELSEFAKPYNVRLMANFQSLGHAAKVLEHPDYRYLGQTERMFKPADTAVLRFLMTVYDEIIPVFSSEYFNINCDEAWDLKKGITEEQEIGSRFVRHVRPLLNHLLQKNKKPMLWGDMLLAHPEVLTALSEETTVLTWNYDALEDFSAYIDPIREAGLSYWVCPGIVNSYRTYPNYQQAFVNLQNFALEGQAKAADGLMTCVWDDGGRHFFAKDWYGVAYGAEQSWHPNRQPVSDYNERYSRIFYLDSAQLFPQFVQKLQELEHLFVTQGLNTHFFQQQLLPKPGMTLRWSGASEQDTMTAIVNRAKQLLGQLRGMERSLTANSPAPYAPGFLVSAFNDLDQIEMTVVMYDQYLISRRGILRMAEAYRQALNQGPRATDSTLYYLAATKNWSQQLRANWSVHWPLQFEGQWVTENRTYWLSEALQVYTKHAAAFKRLDETLEQLEKTLAAQESLVLPSLKAIGLDVRATDQEWLTYWLLSPFCPIKSNTSNEDFIGAVGGEKQARPTVYDWHKHQSNQPDRVELDTIYRDTNVGIIYAYARISCDQSREVKALLEGKGVLGFMVNDQWVFHNKQNQQEQSNLLNLTLQKGNNHLLLKLITPEEDWHFSLSFPEENLRSRKYKYRLLHK